MNVNKISKSLPLWGRVVFVAAAWAWPAGAPASETPDIRRDPTVIAVEEVMPSVVNIATRTVVRVRDPVLEEFFGSGYGQMPSRSVISLGSGVIIDEAGYLLTNDHVVRGASEIAVQFNSGTNLQYGASIVARDEKRDIALLKLDARPGEKFHAIKFAREDDLLVGETVLALGNPFGLGGTVSRGILSAKNRVVPEEGAQLDIPNWLQTDAPINHGNSGGPLVNLNGELIGINVAVLNEYRGEPAQGIGFAIPIRLVEQALADIFPTESVKSYWFGARVKVGTSPLVITSVQAESPAGRAGLTPGDAILEVNGHTPKSFIDFADLLADKAGSDVILTVRRGERQSDFTVRLVPENSVFNADLIRRRLGAALEARTLQVGPRRVKVFVIKAVTPGGPAEAAGLKPEMLIATIDGQGPGTVHELAKLLFGKKRGDAVPLAIWTVQREGDFGFSLQEWDATVTLR